MRKLSLFVLSAIAICGCSKPEIEQPVGPSDVTAINLSKENLTFGAEGGIETVSVTLTLNNPSADSSEIQWGILDGESWCTPSVRVEHGNADVEFTVEANNGLAPRETKFRFFCGSRIKSLTVTQQTASIPNNQIWYISTDGKIPVPALGGFGAGVVLSNTYENGKGVIVFSVDVTTISSDVFRERSSLTNMVIPDSVTSIGNNAFDGCSNLESINIPNGITSFGERAFRGCSSLTSANIPDGVTSIGKCAFQSCTNLTSIVIPEKVTEIGEKTFYKCSNLTSVYCKPATPPTLNSNDVFSSISTMAKIYVPTAVVDNYKSFQYWSDYASQIVGYDF